MPRTKQIKKVQLENDPVYKSTLVTQLILAVMERGKKSLAERIVYGALRELDEDPKKAADLLRQAITAVAPRQEVRSRRIGGATYQVPVPVPHGRSKALAIRWFLEAARARKGVPVSKKIALELKDILAGTGACLKKRSDTHRMAEANKAFAHFRW